MNLKNREEIIYATARKLNVKHEVVLEVIRNYEATLRYFLSHPEETKKGITLGGGLRFFLRENHMRKFVWKNKDKEHLKEMVQRTEDLLKQRKGEKKKEQGEEE